MIPVIRWRGSCCWISSKANSNQVTDPYSASLIPFPVSCTVTLLFTIPDPIVTVLPNPPAGSFLDAMQDSSGRRKILF